MPGRAFSLAAVIALTFAAGFSLSQAATPASMSESSFASTAEGVDPAVLHPMSEQAFDAACKEQGYARGVTSIGSDAYSIRCVNEDGSLQTFRPREEIHNFVAQACQDTYPDIRVTDRLATMAGTYTAWQCADYGSYAGVPDLKGWCESKGLELVTSSNYRYPAYRWFCANSSRTRVDGIPMDEVCQWQFGESALDRVFNVYGKAVEDAWDCFYTD
ncbi:hypothetical protein ACFY0F_10280 [Streptomyces sp. NPDC001544]|uniref:hypothetical protein n=1 Tax=Streptomyces sp. NPDC001544 TaxID=3364584 RepID=UPI003677A057